MYCPQCRKEYPAGPTRCDACGVELVAELDTTAEAEAIDWVTVFESNDPALVPVVRALLEAEQIPCVVEHEPHAEPFPSSASVAGLELVQVPAELAEAARALIADRTSEVAEDSDPVEPQG